MIRHNFDIQFFLILRDILFGHFRHVRCMCVYDQSEQLISVLYIKV